MRLATTSLVFLIASAAIPANAAAQASRPESRLAPLVIPLTGRLQTPAGAPRGGTVMLTVSLYAQQDGISPLWFERQLVDLGQDGGYTIGFGSTSVDGLPAALFVDGTAKWVGVAVESEVEGPRVMLVSVPYAARAAVAETLDGKEASDFVLTGALADEVRSEVRTVLRDDHLASAGGLDSANLTVNRLLKTDGVTTVDSAVTEVGGQVGIGTSAPGRLLDLSAPGGVGLRFQSESSSDFSLVANATGFAFFDDTNAAYRIAITTGGHVGIGVAAPETALQVFSTGVANALMLSGNSLSNTSRKFSGLVGKHYLNAQPPVGIVWYDSAAASTELNFGGGSASLTAPSVISFWTAPGTTTVTGAERLTITGSGNVGVGTTSPASKLDVAGTANVSGAITAGGNITAVGTISAGNIVAKYQDVAEWVESAEALEPGTVVAIDRTGPNRVTASTKSYDTRVAGAVSPQPGLILGEGGPGKVLIAQSGRVRVKVDARYGPIAPGDLLVTSPRAGVAMRSRAVRVGDLSMHRPGTVLGKALEPLASGTGEILVLLTLQ